MGLLEGKVALVTGGSRGLGRSLCQVFAREGAHVAFNWHRSEEDAKETLSLLTDPDRRGSPRASRATPAWSFKASVTDRAAVTEMVRALEAEAGGTIDILVNNAGHGQVVPLALMEEEDWDRMLDTHVKGAFLCSQAVLRGMIKAQRGRILNMSSLAGIKMMQAPVHYCTAKAALKGFTESLAKEIGRYGITVNCLAPGVLEEGVSEHLPQARRDEYLRHCAMRRMGRFDEVAEVAAFLVSDRSSYMNGATIVVDGAV